MSNDRNDNSKHANTSESDVADHSVNSDNLCVDQPEVGTEVEVKVSVEVVPLDGSPESFKYFRGINKPIIDRQPPVKPKRSIWVGSDTYRELGLIDMEDN